MEDGDVMPECGEEMDEMRVCEVPNNKYIEVFEKIFFQMRNIWYICSGIAEEWLCGWEKDEPTTKL